LTLNNPNTSGPSANNWTGGVILDALTGHAINLDLKMGANNQMGPGNVTLAAPNSATTQYARFDLNGTSQTIGALIGTGNETQLNQVGNFGSGAATLTLGANNGSGTFTGNTSDSSGASIAFIKIGTGTQTFDASSGGTFNYHGNTTVNNGTFALTGGISIPNTAVITVASGAIFDVSNLGNFTVGASPAQTLNCVGTVNGNLTINGTIKALDNIGTLTETGSMTLNGGGTYVWDINNATGTAGSDPGWSWLNISGTLTLNASGQFNINVNSLNGETAGNALNFNPLIAQSWIIATAAGGISGYTGPAQFNVVHSAFSNYAGGSWNVSVDITGDNLLLNYNPFNPIVSLTPAALTINQGQNAVFTATANSLGTSPSFTWTQGATTLTPPSGTTAGGGSYTIATSNGGYTSTLTIDDVDAPPNWPTTTDTSTISATVNETYASSPQVGTLSASLTVIDPPINPNVTQSEIAVPVSAGAVNILTSSASGTQPFTYQWYLNGNQINGATGSTFDVNISPTTVGSYTVVIGNAAGNVTSSATDITGPVSVVPNQIIFEPFNYPDQSHNPSPPQPAWDAFGVTNLFNQATGVGLAWVDAGNVDFGTQPAYQLADPYTVSPYGIGTRPIVNDEYPVYGLAGNDVSAIYADSDVNGGQVNLPFGTAITSGTVYGSFVVMLWGMNQAGATTDYLCGFDSGANNSTTHSLGLYVQDNTPATFPNVPYTLGIFKGNLTTSGLSPGSNGNWSPNTFLDYNVLFVVFRLNFNNSPATCDLWINPPASSFYASEANLPTADVANAASGVADVAGGVSSFFMKITTWPVDRLFGDVRIGTTWASVTPPSAPTLSLANQILANSPGTVVFASQNAGNPVSGNYQWSFDNGSGPVTLSDTTLGDGAVVSGSLTATLTIVGATAAELGTYTVTGSNTDPSPGGGSATLTGSASALLTAKRPALSIFNNSPNIIVSWATNWPVALEATTSLAPPITWGPVVGGESSFLDWPPGSGALAWAPVSPKTISGTNYTVTVAASSGPMFFRLAPSP
jgi:hypothetical protein